MPNVFTSVVTDDLASWPREAGMTAEQPVLNAYAITFGDRWPNAETY